MDQASLSGVILRLSEPSPRDGFVASNHGLDSLNTVNHFDVVDSVGGGEEIEDGVGVVVSRHVKHSKDLVQEVASGDELLLQALDEIGDLLLLGLLAQ